MSYTELEHGYQDLRSTSRPIFYVGDINTVQPSHVDPAASSLYRSSKRGELSDGCSNEDGCMGGSDLEGEGKQVLVGICAMAKKSQSKPMKEILTRLEEFEYIKIIVFPEEVILKEPVEDWPIVDCLISFHSKGFPLDKAIHYANLRNPFIINNLPMQYDIQDRRRVYAILDSEGIEIPRYAVLDRDSADPKHHELVESEDHVEVNGVTFNKPFVEKPVSAEDHNIYIYYPTSAGGGSQRLFRKVRKRHSIVFLYSPPGFSVPGISIATDDRLELVTITGIGSRSSVYSPESRVRKTGSYIYEDFMPTDGTDVKVYTVGPDYAHAEARKSPALDGKVERDSEGKEIRYPVILSNAEKLISRKVCLAFKQTVCGFDLLRANGKSFVCDVNGFSFVKNSNKYYDDCAKILGNMILRELAPTLHIPWSVPFQLDDPPIVPTTFGKMMELRCVVAVIRHGDRTPKQKMKVEVRHPKFFEIFAKYDGYKHGHVKLKRPKQLQEILDTARSLLTEIQHRAAGPELEEKQGKLEQLKSVLEMYGHFSGINRKVQMKYQPRGRPRGSSSDDGNSHNRLGEPSLVLILKWGGELTPAGRIQAEELGRIFRCMYPGGQGRHLSEEDSEMLPSHGEYAGAQGLGLLRLHSTFRHDLKIYASDEGRVQMTAAAFAKGLLALEGELTPILVQMVKSANTNGLLDNDCDSSKYQNMVKTRLHELLQQDRDFTREDREQINPGNALSINDAMDFVKNPVRCCQHVQALIQKLMDIVRIKKDDPKTKDAILYHGETWELMGRRWGKIEKDFCTKNKRFDISKIPDIYDCIKYDLQHNNHTLQFDHAEELYIYAKYLADIVIPQEYGLTVQEKLTIGQGICTPLLKKIRADLQRNIEESGEETVNRLNPRYSHGVSSPGRHVRTRLYFTSESHVHSLLTVLRYGGLLDVVTDEQWRRAMEYVSMVSELNYMSQIVVMLYEDPTKDPSSEERFHVELHFSPGVNCCVQKNLPPGPGFRPHSRNESSHNLETTSQCSTRIEEEDAEIGVMDDDATISPQQKSDSSPPLIETEETADSTLDSPTTSRAIDMMDLDPNMMDDPYDSGFLQGSAPIPISARTVAGHEAARLGSQLAASQRQRREREAASSICEPRARSYDHQRQEKPEKTADKLQYQSLDAVNKEDPPDDRPSRRFDVDNLFYETIENLATVDSQSSRNSANRNSPSCLGTLSGRSLYASFPDLPDSLTEVFQPNILPSEFQDRYDKASEKYYLPRKNPHIRSSKVQVDESVASSQESSINDDNDFWDFGETQLLEKIPTKNEDEIIELNEIGKTDETPTISNAMPAENNFVQLKTDAEQSSKIKKSKLQESAESSPYRAGISIDRRISMAIPKARSPLTECNRVMTRSPSYLGIPVTLPHSVSSPELPAPFIETILQSSSPLITLHNKSLASPSTQSPPSCGSFGRIDRADKTGQLTSNLPTRKSCNLMPLALETSETKRYGRSKSALTLTTVHDARGEFGTRIPDIMSNNLSPPNDRLPISNSPQTLCDHCEDSCSMGHQYDSKTSRNSNASQSFQPNTRRSSLNIPETLELPTCSDKLTPVSSRPRQLIGFPIQTYPTLTSLSNPNSRRASLTVLESVDRARSTSPCRDSDRKSQHKCSTSLPLRTHSYSRRTSAVEASTYRNPEHLRVHSNFRRSSLCVPVDPDHEVLGKTEDILHRQNRCFMGRSRSLSPCPQRCLCYNCNVAALIQESVNLSPAERLNFQTYFVRSLSHKFINCTRYKRSLESAEASKRVSRSASPNPMSSQDFVWPNDSKSSFLVLQPYSDAWKYPKTGIITASQDNRVNLNPNDNSGKSTLRQWEHVKRLERRQSSPHNVGVSSKHSCALRRQQSDFVLVGSSSIIAPKEAQNGIEEKSTVHGSNFMRNSPTASKDISEESFSPIVQSDLTSDNNFDTSVSQHPIKESYRDGCTISVDVTDAVGTTFNSDKVVESIDVGPSLAIVQVNNHSSIDNRTIQVESKSASCFPLSRQLSCPEVVIDTSSAYPMGVDSHFNDCTCGDNSDVPNHVNQSQVLDLNSPFLSSMDSLISEQSNDHIKRGRVLPRQISCPEIIAESPNRLIPPQEKGIKPLRRSSIKQSFSEVNFGSSENLSGPERRYVRKTRLSLDRQFPFSTDNDKGDNSGVRTSGSERIRRKEFSLPRQISCPEINVNYTDFACYSLSHHRAYKSRVPCWDEQCYLKSLNPSLSECSHYYQSTADNCQSTLGARCEDAIPRCYCLNCDRSNVSENSLFFGHQRTHRKTYRIISLETTGTMCKHQRHKSPPALSSPSSNPRFQTQRSFSSPDTRPSIIQEPDPTCTARRHRHSISGQMSYFKLLGYNVTKKLTGSANSLFSTAVISGSSSAPNLKDMVPPHASVVAAIEGFGGVPPIRPLETLHNALSLRQLDSFLDMMTSAPLFRTPASSPPKFPSPGGSIHGGSVVPNLSIGGINREYHSSDLEAVRYITPAPIHYKPGPDGEGNDLRSQLSPTSPNSTGWSSEPQSFQSSEPSSPAPTSAGECSMSMSLVSNDGTQPFAGPKFSTTPCLELDFSDFCMSIDQDVRGDSRGSISYTDYYSNEDGLIRKSGPDLTHLRERAERDETSQESLVDEDEEHTLTLRQTEEQRKQDVKFIFDQNKDSSPNVVKPGSSYKKIGRFRVESMEITDEDVRIKEAAAAAAAAAAAVSASRSNSSPDKIKGASTSCQEKSSLVGESVTQDSKKSKGGFSPQPRSSHRGNVITRSQSVSTPQNVCHKTDVDYTIQSNINKTGSFSTMSGKDLENWKATAMSPPASAVVSPSQEEEPLLTLASSLKGSSNITVGFNVQQDKEDKP